MLANVLAIALVFAILMNAQFGQTLLYVKGATARNAARVADIYMNQVEADFVTKASGGTISTGVAPALCLDTNGASQGSYQQGSGMGCTFTATRTITSAGDTNTLGTNPNEVSTNINTSIDESRAAYAMSVQILSPQGAVLANKTRTITIRSIPNATTNSEFVTVINTADNDELLGGGRKGTPSADGDVSGCDPSSQDCGDRSTIQSWSQCSTDVAMAGGVLNTAQQAWCKDHPTNKGYNGHAQTTPLDDYNSTTTYGARTWTNGNAQSAVAGQ